MATTNRQRKPPSPKQTKKKSLLRPREAAEQAMPLALQHHGGVHRRDASLRESASESREGDSEKKRGIECERESLARIRIVMGEQRKSQNKKTAQLRPLLAQLETSADLSLSLWRRS